MADEAFRFAECRAVAVWALKAAWKISGPAMLACIALAAAGSVLPALLMQQSSRILDGLLASLGNKEALSQILGPLILASLCMLGAGVYYLLPELMDQYIQYRFNKGSYRMMIDALGDLPLRWFDDPEFLTDLERYQSSTNITWLALALVNAAGALGASISFLVLAGSISLPILGIILLLAALCVFGAVRLSVREYDHWYTEGDARKRLSWYRSTLTNSWAAKDLRVLMAAPGLVDRWRTEAREALKRQADHDRGMSKRWDRLRVLGFVVQAGISIAAVAFLALGQLSLGQLLLFLSLALSLPANLINLGQNLTRPVFLLRTNRYFKRFFDKDWKNLIPGPPILETAVDDPCHVSKDPATIFCLDNVSYEYTAGHYALKEINLKIKEGEILALVGHNGAGKSTLSKIILGFYRPTSGRVLYRGQAYTPELTARLSREIGASFQDFCRFEQSLRENVAFGDIRFLQDDPVLLKALEKGGAQGLLDRAGGDLETYVGRWYTDDGLALSGGEWQRLASSRAFVNQRQILVMDEPASMLDPEAELKQFAAIRENLGRRTALLISHRIGFARLADRIAVLDGGCLVELGSHDELMAKDGVYAKMFAAQAEWYKDCQEDSASWQSEKKAADYE